MTLPEDAVEVGRVLGAWGIQGAIKVKPFASEPQALFGSKCWHLIQGDQLQDNALQLSIVQARGQGDSVVATAREIPDRNAAEALQGAKVFVSRSSFPTPATDEFYWVDLIGLTVVNREDQVLGEITWLIETGPHCVLRVKPPGTPGEQDEKAEVLIPFVAAYVDKVDLARRRVEVDWQADY